MMGWKKGAWEEITSICEEANTKNFRTFVVVTKTLYLWRQLKSSLIL